MGRVTLKIQINNAERWREREKENKAYTCAYMMDDSLDI